MTFNKSEEQEKIYLQQVITTIKKTIESTDVSVKEKVDTLNEEKLYLWENKDIDPHEVKSVRENILNVFAIGEKVIAKKKRLEKILDSPYFGRIDFQRKGYEVEPVYIGMHTFYDNENHHNIIYDWRAPVSGMYYDYELGKASYETPSGKTDGQILLKRQYRIRKGIMEYMIESSVTIHDDILQKQLSANADDKMRNIVATIQREQNLIIRNEEFSSLIIQGVAGSGKTSIALHRVAYLLYSHKDTLSSSNILIISPNKVFSDYISNVLPELGEERISETSMEAVLSDVLDNKYRFQTFFDQVSEIVEKKDSKLIERIKYKSTLEFVHLLDKFLLHVENTYFRSVDVKMKYITIPGQYIAEQYRRFFRYPVRKRFEVMTEYITEQTDILYRVRFTTTEKNMLKKEITNMFAGNKDLQLYKDFFEWIGNPDLLHIRKNRTLEYSDMAPLAYIRSALEEQKTYTQVKHLIVDEMQDYSPIQYKLIQKLFPCRKTVLGDISQSVNPYGSSSAEVIKKSLANAEIMKLCKSYRSTYEIIELAQYISKNPELEAISRHGEIPGVLFYPDESSELSAIAGLVSGFRKSKYKSLGIICKTEELAEEMFAKIKSYDDKIYFLSKESVNFPRGIIVTSAHMAKGLEFDEVIIPQVNDRNYKDEMDRNMLYVAVTRAMHKLTLTYSEKPSSIIASLYHGK